MGDSISLLGKTIFLDTQVFLQSHFFNSREIKILLNFSRIGKVNLKITQIAYDELVRKSYKDICSLNDKIKGSYRKGRFLDIDQNSEILKALSVEIDAEKEHQQFIAAMNRIFKVNKVEILEYPSIDVGAVFKRYFNSEKPFSKEGTKKYEFPDAFQLEIIRNWMKLEAIDCTIFVSSDQDFQGANYDGIFFIQSVKDVNNSIETEIASKKEKDIRDINLKRGLEVLSDKILAHAKDQILQEINFQIMELLIESIEGASVWLHRILDDSDLRVITTDIGNRSFLIISQDFAKVEFEVIVDYEVTLYLEEEEDPLYRVPTMIDHKDSASFPAIVYIDFFAKELKLNEDTRLGDNSYSVRVDSVNYGKQLDVNASIYEALGI